MKALLNDVRQLRGKRSRKIETSIRRHREDVRHPGILPDMVLVSTAQSALASGDFAHGRLFFQTRIDGFHTHWHKASAVQPRPFAADYVVGMKMPERHRPEEVAFERIGTGDQIGEMLACSTSQRQAGSPDWRRPNSTIMSRAFPSFRRSIGRFPPKDSFSDRSQAGMSGPLIDSFRMVHSSSRSRSWRGLPATPARSQFCTVLRLMPRA